MVPNPPHGRVIVLLVLLACGSTDGTPAAPTLTLPQAAKQTTFAGVTALGSFHLQASLRKTDTVEGRPAKESAETMEIRWKDADHWSYVSARDGRVVSDVRVWDGVAWTIRAGVTEKKGDPEPFRIQVATVWDPWSWGLERLAEDVKSVAGPVELLDGRRAVRYTLALEDQKKGHRTWTPTAVSGDLWIDEATAVRMRGQVRVDATNDKRTTTRELLFTLGAIGADPEVVRPDPVGARAPTRGDKR